MKGLDETSLGEPDEAFALFGEWAGAGPRVSVAIFALDAAGRVLMQLRDDLPHVSGAGLWAPFGGGLEPGETLRACALREFEEETGFRLAPEALRPFARMLSPRPERPRLYTYLARMPAPIEALRLGEGAGFALLTPAQLRRASLAPVVAAATLDLAARLDAGAAPDI